MPEGKEVLITVVGIAEDPDREAFLQSKGGWRDLIDAGKFIQEVCEDRLMNTREAPEP